MSNTHGFSPEEMALLTEEERAGLLLEGAGNDDEGDDNSGFTGTGDEGDDDDGDEGNEGNGQGGDDTSLGNNPGAGAGAGVEDLGAGDDDDDAAAAAAAVQRQAVQRIDVDAAQDRIGAINTQAKALDEKLDDGEITPEEYRQQFSTLVAESTTLQQAVTRQNESDEAEADQWYADAKAYMEKNPEVVSNPTLKGAFNDIVMRVTSDPANQSLSNNKQLALAHKVWREELGRPDPAAKPQGQGQSPKPAAKRQADLPPTLHNIPAAEMSDTSDGKYSYLDTLADRDPIAFENALMKLPEAEQQLYLERGA